MNCCDYRNKISILCKILELVTFLINNEFGRSISVQIDTPIYNQIIKDQSKFHILCRLPYNIKYYHITQNIW